MDHRMCRECRLLLRRQGEKTIDIAGTFLHWFAGYVSHFRRAMATISVLLRRVDCEC